MYDFIFNEVLTEKDFCNQTELIQDLQVSVKRGEKILLFGKRNTGKTSVVRGVLIPYWEKLHKDAGILYCDFLGVRSEEQVIERLGAAVQDLYNRSLRPTRLFQSLVGLAKRLRPVLEIDESGKPVFSIKMGDKPRSTLKDYFDLFEKLAENHIPLFLCLDEFQDIYLVKGLDAIFRRYLEALPSRIPIVILGSKQHLLTRMFTASRAAFFQWGKPFEMRDIPYEEYTAYMRARFKGCDLKISSDVSKYLQDLMQRNPEAINKLCSEITRLFSRQVLEKVDVDAALSRLLINVQSQMEYHLSAFTNIEQEILKTLALDGPIERALSKNFLRHISFSTSGVQRALGRLLDVAAIYASPYCVADPILAAYLRHYRLHKE